VLKKVDPGAAASPAATGAEEAPQPKATGKARK
jgi:hypothetical protein